MKNYYRDWLDLSAAARVLIANALTFNLGFYMLLPYLAEHLHKDLNLTAWLIGMVLGLRVLSQQGLFIIGGTIGDYFGYRPTILIGCLIRTLGFLLLSTSDSLALILIGAFLTGFAGALFTPSSQAYLALECPSYKARNKVFAMQNLASEAGMLLGPLLGLALLGFNFAVIGYFSALLFFILFLIQWRYLPQQTPNSADTKAQSKPAFWRQWYSMLQHKKFMYFILLSSVYQLLFHQLYLAIPNAVNRVSDDSSLITWVFICYSLLAIVLQLPASKKIQQHSVEHIAMGLGIALMGVAFLPLIFIHTVTALPLLLLCATLLSLGSILVYPLINTFVPHYAKESELGAYYGFCACIGGIMAFVGNIVIGFVLSGAEQSQSSLWIGLAVLSIVAGLGLYRTVKNDIKLSADKSS